MGGFIVSSQFETVGQGNYSVLGQVVLVAEQDQSRGGEVATRRAHNPKIGSSNLSSATKG